MSTAAPSAFPGWPAVEAYLLECLAAGDDAKLTPAEVTALMGEIARLQHCRTSATRALRKVAAGEGCWAFEQGYAPCQFKSVDRFLEAPPRPRWWRRLTAGR